MGRRCRSQTQRKGCPERTFQERPGILDVSLGTRLGSRDTKSSPGVPYGVPGHGLGVSQADAGAGQRGAADVRLSSQGPFPGLAQLEDPDPRRPKALRPGRPAEPEGGRAEPGRVAVSCERLPGASKAEPAERSEPQCPRGSRHQHGKGARGGSQGVWSLSGTPRCLAGHLPGKELRHGQA